MSKVVKAAAGVVLSVAGIATGNPWLIRAGVGLTLSGVSELLSPRPKLRASPITSNTSGGLDTIGLVFGSIRVGGKHVVPATVSDNFGEHSEDPGSDGTAESYWVAVAHSLASTKGVNDLGDIYLDGRLISSADRDSNGWVTDPDWLDDDGHPMVQIIDHKGAHNQAADTLLAANIPGWTSAHRLRGIAYTVARFVRPQGEKSEARFQEVFGGRVPEISRVVDGNPCYDVRKDTSRGGSGTHRADDPTTWEWSDNPALIAATYLLMDETDFGVGVDPDTIDWDTVAAAANECDATFDTPSGALAKYKFNGLLDSSNPDENLSHIADAMAGVITYDQIRGKWVMFAGAYDAPVETIDETWLRGDVEYRIKLEIGELYNACKVNYVQPSLDYEPATSLLRTSSTYETADGGYQLTRELHIPGIDHEFRAQRRAIIEVRRSREQKIVSIPCNMKALDLNFWDTVTLDLPDTTISGTYRVIEYHWSDDGFPNLTLLEAHDDTYDTESGDFESRTFPSAPNRTNEVPPKPSGLALTATPEGILARVNPLGRHAYDLFEYQVSTASNFASIEDTIESPDPQLIFRVTTTATRYVRVRAKKNNAYSAYSSTANVTPNPASLGATNGATAGQNLFDSAAELLQDEDVRNDRVVQQALAAYNANPSFEIPREKVNGVLRPASWWASENGTSLSYVDTTTRDIVLVSSGGCISNAAFVPNPNTQYEFTALVRADSGTADFSILAEEYDSDLPSGKRAIGADETESPVQTRTRVRSIANTPTLSTMFTIVSGVYRPTHTTKWVSMSLRANSGACRVEWAVVRELSSRSFAFDNVIRNPGAENGLLTPHAVIDAGGAWTVSNSNPRSGGFSFRYSPSGQTGDGILFFNGEPTDNSGVHAESWEGDLWVFEGYIERSGASSKSAALRLQFRAADGTNISTKTGNTINLTTNYARHRLVGQAPAGTAYVVASVVVYNDGGAGIFWGDDFYLRRVVGTTLGSGLSVGGLVSGFSVNPISGWSVVGGAARINIQASTLTIGSYSISYPTGSVSGLSFNTKYYVYRDDPELDGGGSYAATTSLTTAVSGEGRVYFGWYTTGSGGGSGGGGEAGGGGPFQCVEVDQWVGDVRCADLKVGDLVHAMDDAGRYIGLVPILRIEDPRPEPCVRVATTRGSGIVSTTTPVTTGDLRIGWAVRLNPGVDHVARLYDGRISWEPVRYVKRVGMRLVRRISVGGHSFLHGDRREIERQIFTHNPAKP